MRKIIVFGATLLVSVAVNAQVHRSVSFLKDFVSVMMVSTNNVGITNGTGCPSIYTNSAGTATAYVAGTRPLADVNLWVDRNVSYQAPLWADTVVSPGGINSQSNAVATAAVQTQGPSVMNLSISLVATNAKGTAAVVFRFVPLPDGVHESTTAGDFWNVSVTAGGVTPVCIYTNVPMYKFIGCKALRLKAIYNASDVPEGNVFVDAIRLNGFAPE
jgi:hypothetical protein